MPASFHGERFLTRGPEWASRKPGTHFDGLHCVCRSVFLGRSCPGFHRSLKEFPYPLKVENIWSTGFPLRWGVGRAPPMWGWQ